MYRIRNVQFKQIKSFNNRKRQTSNHILHVFDSMLKLVKLQSLVAKCCKNAENIALRNLQILY